MNWRFMQGRSYQLDKMGLRDLFKAFFTYPTILVYLGLAILMIYLASQAEGSGWMVFTPILATVLIYPLAWYLIHRFILHGRYLYKIRLTATAWKRIHFDHHQDPHNLHVLFGALYTTLPTIFIITVTTGWLIADEMGIYIACASGLIMTCFYEFCHCIQHLNYQPRTAFIQKIKKWHLAHHFHNEQGNYGITNYFWDRLFKTFYHRPHDVPRSKTVFNLGYTAEEADLYPWVLQKSHGIRRDDGPGKTRQKPSE
ncbi:MAG: sterol desaturase family protein [Alphaproteobacteria bacterium]|nr:sterol desaturase family protein [Alphaproteobacteria bacterium]